MENRHGGLIECTKEGGRGVWIGLVKTGPTEPFERRFR